MPASHAEGRGCDGGPVRHRRCRRCDWRCSWRPADARVCERGVRALSGEQFSTPMEEGICLYLHRITPGNVRTCRRASGRTDGASGHRCRSIFTTCSSPRRATRSSSSGCSAWAIRALEDTRVLHASLLNQHGPETEPIRRGRVGGRPDGDAARSRTSAPSGKWPSRNIQPCRAPYVVRMVPSTRSSSSSKPTSSRRASSTWGRWTVP